jgi:hypothetical protein
VTCGALQTSTVYSDLVTAQLADCSPTAGDIADNIAAPRFT